MSPRHKWAEDGWVVDWRVVATPAGVACVTCGVRMRLTGSVEEFSLDDGETWAPLKSFGGKRPPCSTAAPTLSDAEAVLGWCARQARILEDYKAEMGESTAANGCREMAALIESRTVAGILADRLPDDDLATYASRRSTEAAAHTARLVQRQAEEIGALKSTISRLEVRLHKRGGIIAAAADGEGKKCT